MYLYSPYYSAIDLPRCLWSLLNRFRASQGRCLATSTGGVWPYQVGLCTYNQRQTMINHIIYMRHLTIRQSFKVVYNLCMTNGDEKQSTGHYTAAAFAKWNDWITKAQLICTVPPQLATRDAICSSRGQHHKAPQA